LLKEKLDHLEGLNGIRAIACLLVLFAHSNKVISSILPAAEISFARNGNNGVTMFFVLSGFLITFIIYKKGFDNWRKIIKFLIRRALRILPLYYLYIIICLIVYSVFRPELINYDVLYLYVFLMPNVAWILSNGLPNINHYWSLGVEEQFYFFWPIIIKYLFNNLLLFSTFLLAGLICYKMYLLSLPRSDFNNSLIYAMGFHHILLGCIGAIIHKKYSKLIIKCFCNKTIQFISWVLLLILFISNYPFSFKPEFVGLITLIIIYGQIHVKNRLINLENVYLYKIGLISFGIYVYHPLIISLIKAIMSNLDTLLTPLLYSITFYSLTLVLTFIVSYLSYTYYETFFLKLKQKYY